jgi:peptide deformylase
MLFSRLLATGLSFTGTRCCAPGAPQAVGYTLGFPATCVVLFEASKRMQIVQYPHPTLRHKSKPVKRVDAQLRRMVDEMFELMYEHRGIGLAANQVDLPLRLFVMNLASDPDEDEPHVFINPVISSPKGTEEREEGCLSFPELYAPVKRPERVKVTAYNLRGEAFEGELDGLFARVVQHETDHLDGVLFIDRMSETSQLACKESLEAFTIEFEQRRGQGEIESDEQVARRLAELESNYC